MYGKYGLEIKANGNITVTLETVDLKSKYFCNAEQLISCFFLGKPTSSTPLGHDSEAQALRDPADAEQRCTMSLHSCRQQTHPTLHTVVHVPISGHNKLILALTHFFLTLSGGLFNKDCI